MCIRFASCWCALKSVHISNWTNKLNWYMMGHVCIVSRASMPTFHHCTMETIELRVFFTVVFIWMLMCSHHYRRLEREQQEETRDHRTGKGSQSAPLFPRQCQSNQQPFRCHFQLWQCTSTMRLHITMLQWRRIHHITSAYLLWIITQSSLNAVSIHLLKWTDSMHIWTNVH